jgi:hypothetical protein
LRSGHADAGHSGGCYQAGTLERNALRRHRKCFEGYDERRGRAEAEEAERLRAAEQRRVDSAVQRREQNAAINALCVGADPSASAGGGSKAGGKGTGTGQRGAAQAWGAGGGQENGDELPDQSMLWVVSALQSANRKRASVCKAAAVVEGGEGDGGGGGVEAEESVLSVASAASEGGRERAAARVSRAKAGADDPGRAVMHELLKAPQMQQMLDSKVSCYAEL